MELDEFVAQTFIDIVNGVKKAQESVKDTDAIINAYDECKLRNIKFDVATVVEKTKEGEAGGSAKILVAGVDIKGKLGRKASNISRISFDVPVVLPDAKYVIKSGEKPIGRPTPKSKYPQAR